MAGKKKDNGCNSLCCIIYPCCLSILYTVVCLLIPYPIYVSLFLFCIYDHLYYFGNSTYK